MQYLLAGTYATFNVHGVNQIEPTRKTSWNRSNNVETLIYINLMVENDLKH